MQRLLFLFTIVLLIFTGCSKQDIAKSTIPNWYLNAPINDDKTIYGIGEATTLNEAKTSALNEMSSRLIVSVGSSLQQSTKLSQNSYNKTVSQNISIDVKKIEFTNAKIIKNSIINGSYFVLMSVNRVELFNQKKKIFFREDEQIDEILQTNKKLPNKAILEKIYGLQNLIPSIKENRNKALTLYAINNSFDVESYLKKYDNYLLELDSLKKQLKVSVTSNDKNRFFANEVVGLLNKNGYKVVNTNSNTKISINNKIQYTNYQGWDIAKVATTLSVLSNDKIVSNKTIDSIGRSSTSKESALRGASKSFKQSIKKDGLNSLLFGKENK